ncbi:MAG: hypothetical protein HeimC3_14780 [Candidatus Heimdallarchaeota archaeon LC_3]|nr:MAG: hypothetical protein HeimC3_14780 [Candidatus Heimdallarchaeota archaeon LC_3]
MKIQIKLGKKNTIYLPKKVVTKLNLKEGDILELTVLESELVIKNYQNPIKLALYGKKYISSDLETIEKVVEEEQKKLEVIT